MNSGIHRVTFAFALLVLLVAGAASAQTEVGPFQPWNSWWIDAAQGGALGIRHSGGQIQIDRDGDGLTESSYPRPVGALGIPDAAITSLRLTPSRTIVYAFGGSCGSGGAGTLVYFYRVPAFGNYLEVIRAGLCIPNGIDKEGFYDTGLCLEPSPGLGLFECDIRLGRSPRRVAYFQTAAAASGFANFVFVDLTTGVSSTASAFNYATAVDFIHVSVSGTQAFIRHDASQAGTSDYRLVDLCPGTMGQVFNSGGFPLLNRSQLLGAEVTAVSGGQVTIEVAPNGGPPVTTLTVADCLDVAGACCSDFGCLTDAATASECSAFGSNPTFLGPGTTCGECPVPPPIEACCFEVGEPNCATLSNDACLTQGGAPQVGVSFCAPDTCPTPNPTLTIDGPENAGIGDTVTYLLDYANAGGLAAPDVEVEIGLPFGATFVDASNGGSFDGSAVRWVIGDLAAGAGGSLSVDFSIGCNAANQSAYMQGLISYPPTPGGGRGYIPSNLVVLEIGGAAAAALTVSVSGTPSGDPLFAGDELEHVITLTNSDPAAVPGVRVGLANSFTPTGLDYGTAMSFDRVVDAAGGVVDTSGGTFIWTGDVPASATRTIRFVTVLDSCVPPSADTTSLAFGANVGAFDQCDQLIGESGPPPAFAIGHLVDVSIAATNLAPAQRLTSPLFDIDVQVDRPGGTADIRVSIASGTGQSMPGASVSAFVRGLNVTVPPSAPGASYNPITREFAWSGTIPASGSVDIDFTGVLTHCRGEIDLDGATNPACLATPDIRAQTTIAAVPAPPGGPWLAGLAQQPGPFLGGSIEDHIVQIQPGPPVQITTMMCLPAEYSVGMGASPTGDVWVGPLPTYRINPSTLDFKPLDYPMQDIAVDPVDGSVYLAGGTAGQVAKIVRYDPLTDLVEDYYEDSNFSTFTQISVDEDGSIAALAYTSVNNMLMRIDPTSPPTGTVLYDPPSSLLTDLAIDRDGSYLVLDGFFGTTPTVYDVDENTGALTTLVADLRVPFPAGQLWGQIEVDPAGDLFVAPLHPGLGRIRRATPNVGEILRSFTANSGSFTDLAMVSLPIPEPAAPQLAAALLAVLAVLRARARRSGSPRVDWSAYGEPRRAAAGCFSRASSLRCSV